MKRKGLSVLLFLLCLNLFAMQTAYAGFSDVSGINYTLGISCVLLTVLVVVIFVKLKKTQKKMSQKSMMDADTSIGNLAFFESCFTNMISDISRNKYSILYIAIDSNYLSVYHSESAFSEAVKYTAGVLSTFENQDGFCARITENGFVFVSKKPDDGDVENKIENIIGELNHFTEGGNINDRPYFRAVSYDLSSSDINIGYLLYNLRKNCNMLNNSDIQYRICNTHMMNKESEEIQLLEKIENGFENDEFKLYLQFIVDNKTKKIISAEALSRWLDKKGNLIPPLNYIGVMEKYGFIKKLDYFMFEKVCKQLEEWKETEFDTLTVSCNFTRITISEKDFVSEIDKIAAKYSFDRNKLLIEITEDAIEKNIEVAMSNILKVKDFGFRIALDDMGSGYTSLINLCEYPIDIVKLDRTILLKTDKSSGKDLFVGLISLAQNLNLKVVCEGVETEEQNSLVSATACDYIQGWYYSRALQLDEAEEFARRYTNGIGKDF